MSDSTSNHVTDYTIEDAKLRGTHCRYCAGNRYHSKRKSPNSPRAWRASDDWARKHGYMSEDGVNWCCHTHGKGGWGIVGGCNPRLTIIGRLRKMLGLNIRWFSEAES